MRRIVFLSLVGTLALIAHFQESDALTTGSVRDAKPNGTVTTAVPSVEGISIANTNETGTKSQREIAIGDDITQLFFGEATDVTKGNGFGVATQLETISDNVPAVIPVQQEDANIGKAIDSLAGSIPIDSITIAAGEGIQQTVKNVDELITQVQQEANNFGGPVVAAGDSSFTVSEIGSVPVVLPPTETTGSKIFQVELELEPAPAIIETNDPTSVTADIFTSTATAGDEFQTKAAGAQKSLIPPVVDAVNPQTTIPSIFVSSDLIEEPGKFPMDRQEVLSVQVDKDTRNDGMDMKSIFNIPGSAKQIPIFINSKIKHAIFNIHVPMSPSQSPVRGVVFDKPNDSSLEIDIRGQQLPAAIQSTETQMPILPQVAQVQDINFGKSDSVDIPSGGAPGGATGITQTQKEASSIIPEAGFFEIDKIIIGAGLNQTETTPADTFAISGIVAETDTSGDQLLLQVQQQPSADIQNVISEERAMRSALASLASRMNPAQQLIGGRIQSSVNNSGLVISGDLDGDNISLEVIGFIPNNNKTVAGNQSTILVKFDDDGSLSTEVLGQINENQTISISRPSQETILVLNHEGDRENVNVQTVTVSQVHGEIDVDISIEKADDPTQAPTNPFGNSDELMDELDDMSLEVNFNLLPKIKRLLRPQLPTKRPQMVYFRHSGEQDDDNILELNDILANPIFHQKIQEMDGRLKSAPMERGKRLMKKYAEALAMSSAAAATIKFSFYLPLLMVAYLLV